MRISETFDDADMIALAPPASNSRLRRFIYDQNGGVIEAGRIIGGGRMREVMRNEFERASKNSAISCVQRRRSRPETLETRPRDVCPATIPAKFRTPLPGLEG